MALSKEELYKLSHEHPILFIDGACVMCDKFAQILSKKDVDKRLRFAALQDYRTVLGYEEDAILLLINGNTHSAVQAIKAMGKWIKYPVTLRWILRYTPDYLQGMVYRFVAKHRFFLYQKKETCSIDLVDVMI